LFDAVRLLKVGVLLVDHERRILYANPSARAVLQHRDGLSSDDGRICGVDPESDSRLQQLVDTMIGADDRTPEAIALQIDRPSGLLSYQARATQVQGGRRVLMFLSDPALPVAELSCVRQMYGLTTAESEVALLLVEGHDVRQIAELRSVGVETVRTLLKRTFEKTGTRRQIDLVRVVLCGAAAVCACE